ncbi:Transcription factor 21 [Homalodisca vitripennis]|nr:Transcription factor 21 [Homalodisca vitripennis]
MPRRRPPPRPKLTFSEEELDDEDSREKPQQRNAANARERARMRVLSRAFCRLKTTLPWVPPDTKLSKLDTLRLATSYIAHLRAVLCLDDESDEDHAKNTIHPLNLFIAVTALWRIRSVVYSSNRIGVSGHYLVTFTALEYPYYSLQQLPPWRFRTVVCSSYRLGVTVL